MQEQLFKKYTGDGRVNVLRKNTKKEEDMPKKNIGVSPVTWFWAVGLFCVTDSAAIAGSPALKSLEVSDPQWLCLEGDRQVCFFY